MPTVTIARVDGPPATIDPALVLRVSRGLLVPGGEATPVTEIDTADVESVIHTSLAFDEAVALIDPPTKMLELTAPDGSPIAVNAKKITDVRGAGPDDAPGARSVFRIGELRQAVQEPVGTVTGEIAGALE
jgi:hypothetical protein